MSKIGPLPSRAQKRSLMLSELASTTAPSAKMTYSQGQPGRFHQKNLVAPPRFEVLHAVGSKAIFAREIRKPT